ncbi:ERCC4 domain-domain-containing protein [Tuber borchii]|uniref:ERCC4 domain-domain-containing protein n=1 Tax=Tuber borchii TaxID=42251 RepID=A0A2T6ZS13_TUBBO|nr:ERCC4 domain-domain-containing protein [Tuber borchii]
MPLADTPTGEQLQRFLLELGCRVNPTWAPSPSDNLKLVKWRRRVKADFDEDLGMFVLLENEQIRDENHILIYLTAEAFTNIALPATAGRLSAHVQKIKSAFPTPAMAKKPTRLIYLIEGLQALVRKHKNLQNRAFQNRVLSHLPSAPNALGASTALNTDDGTTINEDDVEDALLDLQITHNCLIHHTSSPVETAEWITIFTGDISTIPYKHSRTHLDTSFCTDVGQVKPGMGKRDTYRKMLQEITRVTPAISTAIAREYPDVRRLIGALERGGEDALVGIENSSTRNALQSTRTVGTACSRRIAGVFLGRDPWGVDV